MDSASFAGGSPFDAITTSGLPRELKLTEPLEDSVESFCNPGEREPAGIIETSLSRIGCVPPISRKDSASFAASRDRSTPIFRNRNASEALARLKLHSRRTRSVEPPRWPARRTFAGPKGTVSFKRPAPCVSGPEEFNPGGLRRLDRDRLSEVLPLLSRYVGLKSSSREFCLIEVSLSRQQSSGKNNQSSIFG